RVKQKNGSWTGNLALVNVLASGSTTNPSGVAGGGSINIERNTFDLEATALNGGTPRIRVLLAKNLAYNGGSGYNVRVADLPSLLAYAWCDPSHAAPSSYRHSFYGRNIDLLLWQGGYGAFDRCAIDCRSMYNDWGSSRPGAGYSTPIGDEVEVRDTALYGL